MVSVKMSKGEFKNRLFDRSNALEGLPIKDIAVYDKKDTIIVCLTDCSNFIVLAGYLFEKTLRNGEL